MGQMSKSSVLHQVLILGKDLHHRTVTRDDAVSHDLAESLHFVVITLQHDNFFGAQSVVIWALSDEGHELHSLLRCELSVPHLDVWLERQRSIGLIAHILCRIQTELELHVDLHCRGDH